MNESPAERPLTGRRILITRAARTASKLADHVHQLGGQPLLFPTIETVPLTNQAPLQTVCQEIEAFDWLIFTSANAVRFFLAAGADSLTDSGSRSPQLAVVGSQTAAALQAQGFQADVMPEQFIASAITAALGDVDGQRILLPQSAIARPELAQALRAAGGEVTALPVYQTVAPTPSGGSWRALEAGPDVLTFTSPSTFENFLSLTGNRGHDLLHKRLIAVIGPVTAAAVIKSGYQVDIMPNQHTARAMIDAVARSFK